MSRDHWRTPPGVWRAPLALLGASHYDLDAAADELGGITVPARWRLVPPTYDALARLWGAPGRSVWCNPPFSAGKRQWVARALEQADTLDLRIAYYSPVYADTWADELELASTGAIWLAGGRIRHEPPPGIRASNPQQHAHRIWLLGRGWPEGRHVWHWRECRWLRGGP